MTTPPIARGEVWLGEAGGKVRPVLVLTRTEVIDARTLVTVANITSRIRGLASEVAISDHELGLDRPSVVNCDGIHTVKQRTLTRRLGELSDETVDRVCSAVSYAIGCAPR